jgi:hypothetical protein
MLFLEKKKNLVDLRRHGHRIFGSRLIIKNQMLASHDINAFSFRLSTNVTTFFIYLQTPDEPA